MKSAPSCDVCDKPLLRDGDEYGEWDRFREPGTTDGWLIVCYACYPASPVPYDPPTPRELDAGPLVDEEADVNPACGHCGEPLPEGESMHPACRATEGE